MLSFGQDPNTTPPFHIAPQKHQERAAHAQDRLDHVKHNDCHDQQCNHSSSSNDHHDDHDDPDNHHHLVHNPALGGQDHDPVGNEYKDHDVHFDDREKGKHQK